MRALPWLSALALSLALAVERLWAVLRAPEAVLVGNWHHPDCLSNHWLLVWVARRLAAGQSLVHNPDYYAPVGDHPWLAGNGSEGFLYLPFHLLLGWPAGVGAYALLVLTANGLGGYALARAAGAGPWAGLVGAAAAGSSIYGVQELGAGRFSQANLALLLGGLGAWLALLRAPSRRGALAAGLCTAGAAVLYWYHGLFLALALLLLIGARALRHEPIPLRAVLQAGGLALALAGPALAVYAANWALIPGVAEAEFPHPEAIADSLRLARPFALRDGRQDYWALPLPLLLLGGLALGGAVRRAWGRQLGATELGLWAVVGVFLALALGVNGPLYEPLYGAVGPLRRFWWPHRHVLVAQLAFAALAAAQLSRLAPRWERAAGLAVALSLSPALRAQGDPVQVSSSPVALPPTLHSQLAALPGELVLHLPFTPEVASTQTPLIYQLYHQKRMINGHAPWVGRVRPPAWDRLLVDNSLLAALAAWERGQLQGQLTFDPDDLEALRGQGLAYIVLEREQYPLALRALYEGTRGLLGQLFGEPVLHQKDGAVYALERWSGQADVVVSRWTWPVGLRPGGQRDQPLNTRRSASRVFDPQVHEDRPRRH